MNIQFAPAGDAVSGTTNYTTDTIADVIALQGAGDRVAVMGILVTNAHTTTATKVQILDGDSTVKVLGYAAAEGGFSVSSGGQPIFIGTANTAVRAKCVTTGANIDVTIWGYVTK